MNYYKSKKLWFKNTKQYKNDKKNVKNICYAGAVYDVNIEPRFSTFDSDIYNLNYNNIDKKIPFGSLSKYKKIVIPQIEKACKYIQGDTIKNKIFNYIIYYYNKDITEGIFEGLNVWSNGKTKKIQFKITKNNIYINLITT